MERRAYFSAHLALLAAICALYALNRFCLAPHSAGLLRVFLAGHFADLLAGAMALAVAAVLMELGRLPRLSLPVGVAVLAAASLLWEGLAPLVKPSAVFDWWDVACYFAGGGLYALFRRLAAGAAKRP